MDLIEIQDKMFRAQKEINEIISSLHNEINVGIDINIQGLTTSQGGSYSLIFITSVVSSCTRKPQ